MLATYKLSQIFLEDCVVLILYFLYKNGIKPKGSTDLDKDLEAAFANALIFTVISLVQFTVEHLIALLSLRESFISYFYFELVDFSGWIPNIKKLNDASCRYLKFDNPMRIRLWLISDLINYNTEVPFMFS